MPERKKLKQDDYQFLHQLSEQPYQFDFYQAIRRLECIYNKRLANSLKPSDDPVRLNHEGTIAFAPSTIYSFTPSANNKIPQLSSYFFGLLGPQGPLPLHITEYIRDRKRADDETMSSFLDLFHHRMLSFFYRTWANNQPTVNLDHADNDSFKRYVGSFSGIGAEEFFARDELPDSSKLFISGHLSCQTKHPQGLEYLIYSYFKIPVKIKEFIGAWITLPEDNICRLGLGQEVNTLGENVIVGKRIWEAQQKFRICFGPLDFAHYKKFLPGNKSLKILIAMVKNYVGDVFNWDLQLILKKQQVPFLKMDGNYQLGYTTWGLSVEKKTDADELILIPLIN